MCLCRRRRRPPSLFMSARGAPPPPLLSAHRQGSGGRYRRPRPPPSLPPPLSSLPPPAAAAATPPPVVSPPCFPPLLLGLSLVLVLMATMTAGATAAAVTGVGGASRGIIGPSSSSHSRTRTGPVKLGNIVEELAVATVVAAVEGADGRQQMNASRSGPHERAADVNELRSRTRPPMPGAAVSSSATQQRLGQSVQQQQPQQLQQQNVDAYEVPDPVLLNYVKAQVLHGLGLYEAPLRVRRATHDSDYQRVYEEYRRRLEEDDLLDEAEDDQEEDKQGGREQHGQREDSHHNLTPAVTLQRLYTLRATAMHGVREKESGYAHNVRFHVPDAARRTLISAKLRLRRLPPRCSVKVYKVDEGLQSLVADLRMPTGAPPVRGSHLWHVVDLTSSMKGWLRADDTVEFHLWESRRGCVRDAPTFDVMAAESSQVHHRSYLVGPRSRRLRRSASVGGRGRTNTVFAPHNATHKLLGSSTHLCSDNGDKACCLRRLSVNFTDLGWNDWIVEPQSFEAYFCRGQCYYKYGLFASTHAIVQSKMSRLLGPKVVPRPCCTPKKYKPLPVMYRDGYGNVRFGRIPKMIVKECTCR